MVYDELGERVNAIQAGITPAAVERASLALMEQGEDVGGGVNALRLVKHLLGEPDLRDARAVWAYDRLKPALRAAFEHIRSLYYFEGD
jgi:hypothetical protein